MSVEDVFGGLRSTTAQFLFDSDAPNAAAYSSASALLLAMIFCLRVYAFRV